MLVCLSVFPLWHIFFILFEGLRRQICDLTWPVTFYRRSECLDVFPFLCESCVSERLGGFPSPKTLLFTFTHILEYCHKRLTFSIAAIKSQFGHFEEAVLLVNGRQANNILEELEKTSTAAQQNKSLLCEGKALVFTSFCNWCSRGVLVLFFFFFF